ncbi:MAG TPA: alpha/beta hydrolase [Candidatus Binatia bacterium]|nr:alpha/beta hydrolase [Candidatus Binatia bacterium]
MPREDLEPLFAAMRAMPPAQSIAELRQGFAGFMAMINAGAPEVAAVHADLPVADGVRVDVLVPHGTPPFPVLVYLHGGGWSIGNCASHAKLTRQLAVGSGALVVSVDYRLSPEHPFPAPLEDCVRAVRWARENVARFGGDPARIAIGGDSAGGNLSASVANELRGEVDLRAALLIYGAFEVRQALRDYDLYAAPGGDPVLPRPMMEMMIDAYLSGGASSEDPRVSPLHGDLSKFPPSCLLCGDLDPLYGDTLHFHDALRRARRESELHVYRGMPHAFVQLAVREADEAVAAGCAFLRRKLAG